MKLLSLSYELTRSHGWGRYAVEVIQRLRETGADIKAYHQRGGLQDSSVEGIADSCLVSPKSMRWGHCVAYLESFLISTEARSALAIHAMDESVLPLAYYLSLRSGRPFVSTIHGTYCVEALTGPARFKFRKMFSQAAGLISVSTYTKKRFLSEMPEASGKLEVVPLGVDSSLIEAVAPSAGAREPILLSVGAVKRRKGLLQVVRAVGSLRERLPKARVVVAGKYSESDPYVAEVRRAAASLGIADRVELLGEVDEDRLNSLYRKARALVMPSQNIGNHFEGFGLVHLEAAAKGLPAIGAFGCGNEDAIVDGKTGFLVGQSDVAALAARIEALFDDEGLWNAMSSAGLDFARSMNWTRTSATTHEILLSAARNYHREGSGKC